MRELGLGVFQPQLEIGGGLGSTSRQASPQVVVFARRQENEDGVWNPGAYASGAMDVHSCEHILAASQGVSHLLAGQPVRMTVMVVVLQQAGSRLQPLERLFIKEVIVDAVPLPRAG